MMRPFLIRTSAVFLVAVTGPARAEPEISFREAAATVSASIQERFALDSGLYARSVTDRAPDFMWGNGVMFSSLVAAARHDPATYRPVMDRFFAAMDRYWDTGVEIPGYEPAPTRGGGNDKYYDDNQWMVITFVEAYEVTNDERYLQRARETLHFSLSGWDDAFDGGIWWHEGHKDGAKNTCSNAPAAVACLRVARWLQPETHTAWAERIVRWTTEHLQDDDALFLDHVRVRDGHIDRRKFTYNSALMIRANLGLHRATGDAAWLAAAEKIGKACDAFVRAETGRYRDSPRFTHLLVEADLELHRATGDEVYLERARRHARAVWASWKPDTPPELIEQAGIARTLWLLAEAESEAGRAFWTAADRPDARADREQSAAPATDPR